MLSSTICEQIHLLWPVTLHSGVPSVTLPECSPSPRTTLTARYSLAPLYSHTVSKSQLRTCGLTVLETKCAKWQCEPGHSQVWIDAGYTKAASGTLASQARRLFRTSPFCHRMTQQESLCRTWLLDQHLLASQSPKSKLLLFVCYSMDISLLR